MPSKYAEPPCVAGVYVPLPRNGLNGWIFASATWVIVNAFELLSLNLLSCRVSSCVFAIAVKAVIGTVKVLPVYTEDPITIRKLEI